MMQRGWSTHNISWSTQPAAQQISNYELFNCNNFNIRYRSWNYRGCWHQTCPPIDHHRSDLNTIHPNYCTKNYTVLL